MHTVWNCSTLTGRWKCSGWQHWRRPSMPQGWQSPGHRRRWRSSRHSLCPAWCWWWLSPQCTRCWTGRSSNITHLRTSLQLDTLQKVAHFKRMAQNKKLPELGLTGRSIINIWPVYAPKVRHLEEQEAYATFCKKCFAPLWKLRHFLLKYPLNSCWDLGKWF